MAPAAFLLKVFDVLSVTSSQFNNICTPPFVSVQNQSTFPEWWHALSTVLEASAARE
jgi:hypothetical protein